MSAELRVLWGKISGGIAKVVTETIRGREVKFKAVHIEFRTNGKAFKITIQEL